MLRNFRSADFRCGPQRHYHTRIPSVASQENFQEKISIKNIINPLNYIALTFSNPLVLFRYLFHNRIQLLYIFNHKVVGVKFKKIIYLSIEDPTHSSAGCFNIPKILVGIGY